MLAPHGDYFVLLWSYQLSSRLIYYADAMLWLCYVMLWLRYVMLWLHYMMLWLCIFDTCSVDNDNYYINTEQRMSKKTKLINSDLISSVIKIMSLDT